MKNYLSIFFVLFNFNLILSQTTITVDFDSYGGDTNISTGDGVGDLWNGASSSSTSGQYPWRVESGNGANSSNTGPASAYNGTGYLYAETSSDATGDEFILETDTFTSSSTPTMSFYYHMYGATIGTLTIQESTNGGSSWSTLLSLGPGQIQDQEDDAWIQASSGSGGFTAISSNANKVRIRYVSGSSYTSDAAIDNIVFTYTPPPPLISHDFESSANGWTAAGSVNGTAWQRTNSLGQFETGNSGYAWTIFPHNNYSDSSGAYVTSSALDFSKAVYDLEIISGSTYPIVTRLLQGTVTLDKEVTTGGY